MALAAAVGVVLVVLPGALVLATYAVTRERLRAELSSVPYRSVRASWIAASVALLVGAALVAYTSVVTMGRLSPAWPGTAFWLEHFLTVYQVAGWALLGGFGLSSLGSASSSSSWRGSVVESPGEPIGSLGVFPGGPQSEVAPATCPVRRIRPVVNGES